MAQRSVPYEERMGGYRYRGVEVTVVRQSDAGHTVTTLAICVDTDPDTLRFVRENMHEIVRNAKGAFRATTRPSQVTDRSTNGGHPAKSGLLDRLSPTLKKAFLTMALERNHNDRHAVCKMLGISTDRLITELTTCGLIQKLTTA